MPIASRSGVVKFVQEGKGIKVLDAPVIERTYAEWKEIGAKGYVGTWPINSGKNPNARVGDVACLSGVVSDRTNKDGTKVGVSLHGQITDISDTSVTTMTTAMVMAGIDGQDGERARMLVYTYNVDYNEATWNDYQNNVEETLEGTFELQDAELGDTYMYVGSDENGNYHKVTMEIIEAWNWELLTVKGKCTIHDISRRGLQGPLYYPAGSYVQGVEYNHTNTACPFVEQEGQYYMLAKIGPWTGTQGHSPKEEYAAKGKDSPWQLMDKQQAVFTEVLFANFAKLGSAVFNGDYMFSQHGLLNNQPSSDYWKDGFVPNVMIDWLDGLFTAKKADISGKITATEGQIAGFKISGEGLTNDPFENDAYIVFRNDAMNTFAGIGGNVLPASSGSKAVARFENKDNSDSWGLGTNYGMLVAAQGAHENVALQIDGGAIEGLAYKNIILDDNDVNKQLGRYTNNILCVNDTLQTVYLPTMRTYDDGHSIKFKVLGNGGVKIKASSCETYNGQYVRTSIPCIVYDRGYVLKGSDGLQLQSLGDASEFVWCRGLIYTVNGTTYYGAWVQYKIPRDW